MDRKPTISVIIPVYNAEKYIRRCVESILVQTFEDFELLLVDDGSPDHSGEICDEYAQKDSRVRVFHKSNGGTASARNYGLDHFQGDYVAFIDNDDYVEPTYLDDMLNAMTRCGADLVCCGVWYFEKSDGSYGRLRITDSDKEYNRSEALIEMLGSDSYDVWLWNKLFKASIIKNNGIKLCNGVGYADDMGFVTDYIMHCSKVVYISKTLYHYMYYEKSSSHATVVNGKFNYMHLDLLKGYEMILNTVKPLHDKAVTTAVKGYIFSMSRFIADLFLSFYDGSDKKTLRLLRRKLTQCFPYYLRCPRLFKATSRKDALKILFYVHFPSRYKRIYK